MGELLQDITGIVHSEWVATVITGVIIVAATYLIERLITKFMRRMMHLGEDINLPSGSIFVNIVRGAVWVLGVCVLLSTCFGVDVSAAITALGIGGIAVSLGCQDTISNLIGGLQLSIMRLVVPGDRIEASGAKGVVQDVAWRHTTIRTATGEEVIIPNSVINKASFVKLPEVTTVKLPIVVPAEAGDLDERARLIEEAAAQAAEAITPLASRPALTFSALEAMGFKGTLSFGVEDADAAAKAGDAALRAIAPLVGPRTAADTGANVRP